MRTILFAAALLAVTGGIAVASIPARDGTLTACVSKKSGAVRAIDTAKTTKCRKGEKKVVWGQRGPAGARGVAGPAGARGPGGTVDTSSFSTRSESDDRYLGKAESAVNALRLGDESPDNFMRGRGKISMSTVLVRGGEGGALLTVRTGDSGAVIGHLESSCPDPATTTGVRWRNDSASTVEIVLADDGSGTTTTPTGPGTFTPLLQTATGRHVEYVVYYSTTSFAIDVWMTAAPGGANSCGFRLTEMTS